MGEQILFRMPQRLMLGPIMFNIFLSDPFLVLNEIDVASYVDDNTLNKALTTLILLSKH